MNHMVLKDGAYAQGFFVPDGAILVSSPPPTKNHTLDKSKEEWVFSTPFSDEEAMKALRMERNRRIADCDWMANSDVTMSDAWKTYRQKLRDITKTASPKLNEKEELTNVTWPTEPS